MKNKKTCMECYFIIYYKLMLLLQLIHYAYGAEDRVECLLYGFERRAMYAR